VNGCDDRKLSPRPLDRVAVTFSPKQHSDVQTAGWILFAICVLVLVVGVRSWASRVEFVPSIGWVSPTDVIQMRTVDLGIEYSMFADSSSTQLLASGFGEPEPDGTWIVELDSQIELWVEGGSPETLELALFPFLFEELVEREIDIRTSVGMDEVKLIDGINTVSVALDGERHQVVDIGCNRVDSPRDVSSGADERTLCAKLLSVRVD
jgi:hypothetical protein